jgi:hypothetical protein
VAGVFRGRYKNNKKFPEIVMAGLLRKHSRECSGLLLRVGEEGKPWNGKKQSITGINDELMHFHFHFRLQASMGNRCNFLYLLAWTKLGQLRGGHSDNDMVLSRDAHGFVRRPDTASEPVHLLWWVCYQTPGSVIGQPMAMGKDFLPGVWGKKLVRFSPTKFWHHTHTSLSL